MALSLSLKVRRWVSARMNGFEIVPWSCNQAVENPSFLSQTSVVIAVDLIDFYKFFFLKK